MPDVQPKPTAAAEVREQVARTLWIGEQETDEARDAAARYWDDTDLTDTVIPRPYYRAQADRLAAAGLLATAEHDAQVLRDAAYAYRAGATVVHDGQGDRREVTTDWWLYARADRIATGGGS